MNRILLREQEVSADGYVVLDDVRAAHIRTVLRAGLGDSIRVGVIDGPCGDGEVVRITDRSVELKCHMGGARSDIPWVDLLLAMPRPKVMKRLWAPLASLGVGRIIITNAARVERNYFDTHWLDRAHYEPRLIEGLQQSGLTRLPEVTVVRRFRPLVEDRLDTLAPGTTRLVAHPYAAMPLSRERAGASDQRTLIAVGPEGGWVPFEMDLMETAGFQKIAIPFGPLRTDVACIALIAMVGGCRTGDKSGGRSV